MTCMAATPIQQVCATVNAAVNVITERYRDKSDRDKPNPFEILVVRNHSDNLTMDILIALKQFPNLRDMYLNKGLQNGGVSNQFELVTEFHPLKLLVSEPISTQNNSVANIIAADIAPNSTAPAIRETSLDLFAPQVENIVFTTPFPEPKFRKIKSVKHTDAPQVRPKPLASDCEESAPIPAASLPKAKTKKEAAGFSPPSVTESLITEEEVVSPPILPKFKNTDARLDFLKNELLPLIERKYLQICSLEDPLALHLLGIKRKEALLSNRKDSEAIVLLDGYRIKADKMGDSYDLSIEVLQYLPSKRSLMEKGGLYAEMAASYMELVQQLIAAGDLHAEFETGKKNTVSWNLLIADKELNDRIQYFTSHFIFHSKSASGLVDGANVSGLSDGANLTSENWRKIKSVEKCSEILEKIIPIDHQPSTEYLHQLSETGRQDGADADAILTAKNAELVLDYAREHPNNWLKVLDLWNEETEVRRIKTNNMKVREKVHDSIEYAKSIYH